MTDSSFNTVTHEMTQVFKDGASRILTVAGAYRCNKYPDSTGHTGDAMILETLEAGDVFISEKENADVWALVLQNVTVEEFSPPAA